MRKHFNPKIHEKSIRLALEVHEPATRRKAERMTTEELTCEIERLELGKDADTNPTALGMRSAEMQIYKEMLAKRN